MSQESDLKALVQQLIDVVKDQGKSMQTFINHQRDQGEAIQTFMQNQQEILMGMRDDFKELRRHVKSSAPESCIIPSAVKVSQTESVTQLEASLLKIFSNSAVVTNNTSITYKMLLNGKVTKGGAASAAALIGTLNAAHAANGDSTGTAATTEMLGISEADAQGHEDISKLMEQALQQLEPYKNPESVCQASLKELTELAEGGLRDALDLSENFIGCPFQLWKTDNAGLETSSHNTGHPFLVSTALPMFLEVKKPRPGNIFGAMRQAVERAYSMISYNCLLLEVVGFVSTYEQNWVIRVTRKERANTKTYIFEYIYEFNFIPLGSAGCIGGYWNALSATPASTPCRFFHPHWYLLLKSMRDAQNIPMFAWAYHKISFETRTASIVYVLHKSKGIDEVFDSTTNEPIFIVKVNGGMQQGQGQRASNEFDVINRLLVEHHGARGTASAEAHPHSYPHAPSLKLFHVVSCWRLRAGDAAAQFCRNEMSSKFSLKSMPWLAAEEGGGEAMEYEALLRRTVQEIDDDLPRSAMSKEDIVAACARPCWWNPRLTDVEALFAGGSTLGYFTSTYLDCVTVTVMRAGVPVTLASQISQVLGIDLSPRYIRCRLYRWLQEFCHRSLVLHCDSRPTNRMIFMYHKEEVEAAAPRDAESSLQSDSSGPLATTLIKCTDGCYFDVQLVDFDLSVCCKDAIAATNEVQVEVREGAQKDLMVDVLLDRGRLWDIPTESTTILPWNMTYDLHMLS